MRRDINLYLESLKYRFPTSVIEGLLIILIVGVILILAYKGKHVGRAIASLLLIEYACILYCSTVVFRISGDVRKLEIIPFWSYSRQDLMVENLMNVLAFIPVGLLSCFVFNRAKWWQALLIGLGLSLSIEVLQYALRRGFTEFDDVFHNTLGCLIGLMIVALIKNIWKFCSYLFWPQWGRKNEVYNC